MYLYNESYPVFKKKTLELIKFSFKEKSYYTKYYKKLL